MGVRLNITQSVDKVRKHLAHVRCLITLGFLIDNSAHLTRTLWVIVL